MENYHYIAITISIISLLVSLYTYRKTYALNLDTRNLNYRKALSEQYEEYSTLLHSEYKKLESDISGLSSVLCRVNTSIGNVLDNYDSRNRNSTTEYQRYLRHLYGDLHDSITKSLSYELSWQTPENVYHRLAIFKYLDHNLDLNRTRKSIWRKIFKIDNNNSCYPEYNLSRSAVFSGLLTELTEAVNENNHTRLYNDFVQACEDLTQIIKVLGPKCIESHKQLESGKIKNSLQEFKLRENSSLYSRYLQYMNLLKLISQSNFGYLEKVEEIPHLPVSQVVYYGANISLINELLCRTTFSFEEQV